MQKKSRSAAQEAAQTQAALNEKNFAEKFTSVMRRTQLRALRRDSSQSDVHECETSVRRSATMQQDSNVSPQSSQAPSATTGFTRKSHERQPTKRRQECLKHERERAVWPHQTCGPVDHCTHVRVEACPLTTRHKARSKERQLQKVKAL